MEIDSNEEMFSEEKSDDVTNEEVPSSGVDDDEMLIEDSDDEAVTNKEEYSDEVFCEEEREFVESDGDEHEHDEIVDQSLNNEEMPLINGEFAPYFKNVTEALMFCWIQKHNICKFLY